MTAPKSQRLASLRAVLSKSAHKSECGEGLGVGADSSLFCCLRRVTVFFPAAAVELTVDFFSILPVPVVIAF